MGGCLISQAAGFMPGQLVRVKSGQADTHRKQLARPAMSAIPAQGLHCSPSVIHMNTPFGYRGYACTAVMLRKMKKKSWAKAASWPT